MNNQPSSGNGFLRVIVQTAGGALPVEGASVDIYGSDRGNGNTGLLYSLETGIDGLTPPVELPAPPRAESLTPGTPTPFARYNVEIFKEGYNRVTNLGVPVFDGIVSSQPVLLLPTVLGDETGESIVESPETGNALYGGGRNE